MTKPTFPTHPHSELAAAWTPNPPPENLIFDDGEPLESNRHRIAMNLLIDSLHQAWCDRDDYFCGGNMFIYYSARQARNLDFRGPDFFVALNVDGRRSRQGWVVWEEEGRYPDVIIELMSASTASVDLNEKKHLYEQTFRTRDYFVYDPFDPASLRGWQLNANHVYEEIEPSDRGWLRSPQLGLWLGTWEGTISRETAVWLRFYHPDCELVLLPAEAERDRAEQECQRAEQEHQRAEQERQRAEKLAAQLRSLGVDPDTLA
jgi:Uma2 family endonuclease